MLSRMAVIEVNIPSIDRVVPLMHVCVRYARLAINRISESENIIHV